MNDYNHLPELRKTFAKSKLCKIVRKIQKLVKIENREGVTLTQSLAKIGIVFDSSDILFIQDEQFTLCILLRHDYYNNGEYYNASAYNTNVFIYPQYKDINMLSMCVLQTGKDIFASANDTLSVESYNLQLTGRDRIDFLPLNITECGISLPCRFDKLTPIMNDKNTIRIA